MRIALVAAVLIGLIQSGFGKEFPERVVTIVVPFASGASTDIVARFVAQGLSSKLGQSVIVENKPGAGSVIGTDFVARSQPDGHTLLMATLSSVATNPSVFKKLSYNPKNDFVPIIAIAKIPFVLVANDNLPVKNISELIAFAKVNENKINMGSAGPGSAHHLFAELFASMADIKFAHVPYRGSLPALNGLLTKSIDVTFTDLPPAKGMIEGGKLRPLAVSTATRIPELPHVPTLNESGVPGYDAAPWFLILAPAKTPRAVVERLHVELQAIVSDPETRRRINDMSLVAMDPLSLTELETFVTSEIERWSRIVHKVGLAGSQ
ncbi:Bug family tripartite tricarboxylate transporter substrate binding protein [Pseudorhodoplanes sp.]|uniref:Bug family tripartite tricarboxylate transporter substrate binding protein n=1 Tax=Pseudorhodoplanes sp. TaxID=1934341 RepID=UPI003D0BB1A5